MTASKAWLCALGLAMCLLGCGSAHADDITVDPHVFVSAKSRTEVRSELAAFKKGGPAPWAPQFNQLTKFKGTRTRDEVGLEFRRERSAVAAFVQEDSGSAFLARERQAGRT